MSDCCLSCGKIGYGFKLDSICPECEPNFFVSKKVGSKTIMENFGGDEFLYVCNVCKNVSIDADDECCNINAIELEEKIQEEKEMFTEKDAYYVAGKLLGVMGTTNQVSENKVDLTKVSIENAKSWLISFDKWQENGWCNSVQKDFIKATARDQFGFTESKEEQPYESYANLAEEALGDFIKIDDIY